MSTGRELVTDITSIAKAMIVGEGDGADSNAVEQVDDSPGNDVLRDSGTLIPPYDPDVLAQICENSSTLRPNIDAYIINVDSYGHTFKPIVDLEAPDADKRIKDALRYDLKREPKESEVTATKKQLELDLAIERQKLDNFFEYCGGAIQFSGPEGLRGLTRMDLEVTGNAYWEVIRDSLGDVRMFNRLPSKSVRITSYDKQPVVSKDKRKSSLLTVEEIEIDKKFRRFVQSDGRGQNTKVVFFKEYGDTRIISTLSGKSYDTVENMMTEEEKARPATEVIHFKVSSPRSEYGVPRWIGVLLAVLGNRQAEEVNFMYFDNKSIPPLAVLVNGGRLSQDSVKRLEDYIKNKIHGRKNFHSILILEAESALASQFGTAPGETDNGRMKIMIQPLTEAQQKDGLFLQYDERNADKVGQSFRLPRLLRGDIRDFNRSTAVAALDFAEVQVFNPLRQQFDWVMNRLMLTVLDARYHNFVSNAATIRDPEALSTMITELTKANVLTPEEARELSQDVFHKDFVKIDADWTRQPVGITVSGRNQDGAKPGAGQQGQGAGALSVTGAGSTQTEVGVSRKALASAVVKLHDLMVDSEIEDFKQRETEVISVPDEIFFELATADNPPKK